MHLDGPPSWRQGSRPQPVNQAQNLCEQSSGDSDLCKLKGDMTAMSHDLRVDLDELVAHAGKRLAFNFLPQRQCRLWVYHRIS